MIAWNEKEQLDYLQRLPWTIVPQQGDEPGDLVLTCPEIPAAIGTGRDEDEVANNFWQSLRLVLRSCLREKDPIPLPARAPRTLPWAAEAPAALAFKFQAVMTSGGATQTKAKGPEMTAGIDNARDEAGTERVERELTVA
ncbi:MAG: hypothetical protein HOQ11_06810 [Gemmatimonadaceae bacterium]|nr:hypothetical protein [Gemmatimonadaceae bacterium]NUQ94473.1 hypothetical protein [Gemmatimonadaceae bacterium]NUR32445.1 hypothetical protein [Gemmatimonadaceae bacterium]NUS97100.1 hypothetical protein [Gemmatimonadaceae bacterium]